MEVFSNYVVLIAIYAIFALSLSILLGQAGQLSLAQAAFGGVGGYTAAYLAVDHGWSFLPALAAGIAAAALCGGLVALPALFLDTRYLILLTLAVSESIVGLVTAIPALGGHIGISPLPIIQPFGTALILPSQFLPVVAIPFILILGICWRLKRSPLGRTLRAIRDDESATQALGKNTFATKVMIFAVTSGMAGTAGVLLVYYTLTAQVDSFNLTQSMLIVAMVTIGGSGNLAGAILGAAIVETLEPVLQNAANLDPTVAALWSIIVYGLFVVVFIVLRPEGILSEKFSILRVISNKLRKEETLPHFRHGRWSKALRTRAERNSQNPDDRVNANVRGRPHFDGGIEPMIDVELSGLVPASLDKESGLEALADSAELSPDQFNVRSRERTSDELADVQFETNVTLEVRGLGKEFGGIRAASELSLMLRSGYVTGLIGPNGAGKTTVFNLITGYAVPDSGTVILKGSDITGWAPHRVASAGMVRSFQDVRIFAHMTVLENVAVAVPRQVGGNLYGAFARPVLARRDEFKTREKSMEYLRIVGLANKQSELAGSLPLGEQKLLAIARLLATEADVLLLDEPATGIDIGWVERILDVIRELRSNGKTICIVEHNLHVVEQIADWIYFMEAGSVTAEGQLRDLIQQERLAQAYFGSA